MDTSRHVLHIRRTSSRHVSMLTLSSLSMALPTHGHWRLPVLLKKESLVARFQLLQSSTPPQKPEAGLCVRVEAENRRRDVKAGRLLPESAEEDRRLSRFVGLDSILLVRNEDRGGRLTDQLSRTGGGKKTVQLLLGLLRLVREGGRWKWKHWSPNKKSCSALICS